MIIVDRELRRRAEKGRPVRVGIVGAGAMGRGITLQIFRSVPGMEVAAISNRTPEAARDAYFAAGAGEDVGFAESAGAIEDAVAAGSPVITDDPANLCAAEGIDVVLEVTGAVEFGAEVVLDAIEHGKDVVTMNAELQGTVDRCSRPRPTRPAWCSPTPTATSPA